MTYRAMDEDDNTATLDFTITVETATVVRTLVSAVAAGDADGRLRFMDLPEPADGPAVAVAGNPIVTAGGSFFLNVATDAPPTSCSSPSAGSPSGTTRSTWRPPPPPRTA